MFVDVKTINRSIRLAAALAIILGMPGILRADEAPASTDQLSQMSLEDLMNVEVTSVSKTRQRIADAPAAVTVITQEDIQRSGLQSIPELLRLVPGMQVARINAGVYAISSRGFNDRFSNKLLVLFDGREVYNPYLTGMTWETQDYILPDLERIEVIRGPGATLWGANAVNGVINITSKSAQDTQGLLLDTRASNIDNSIGLRYGGKIDDQTWYRVWGKFTKVENFSTASGDPANDAYKSPHGGLRIDRVLDTQDTLTIQAKGFDTEIDSSDTFSTPGTFDLVHVGEDRRRFWGGVVLGRWKHVESEKSDMSLQVYYDHSEDVVLGCDADRDIIDLDFQQRFPIGQRQSVTWGLGYRQNFGSAHGQGIAVFSPADTAECRVTSFVQDDVTILPDRLHFVLGTKLEQNSRTGFEFQPSVRLICTPDENHTIWGAISRAVRTPSSSDQDGRAAAYRIPSPGPGQPGVAVDVIGDPNLDSEELTAFELGYRARPTESLTLDIAAFFNRYDKLIASTPTAPVFVPGPAPYLLINRLYVNGADAETYGIETSATWRVADHWRLLASYSFLDTEVHRDRSVADSNYEIQHEGSDPHNQFQLHSRWDITRKLELNTSLYYVESLGAIDVPGYVRIDAGLTWHPTDNLNVTVGVQNILDDRHPEFSGQNNGETSSEVPRIFYGGLTWNF